MKKSLNRLAKLSLCTVALTLTLGKTAQAQPTSRHVFVPGNAQQNTWVPVKKGEAFNVTTEAATAPRHHFLTKALGVLGIAAANYQTQQYEAQSKLVGVTKRPYLVPGIGLGLGAAATELLSKRKRVNAGLRYAFFNKDSILVSTGAAGKPKKGKLELQGTAPDDGFLQVLTTTNNAVEPSDVAIDIVPAKKGSVVKTNLMPSPIDDGGDDGTDCSVCYIGTKPGGGNLPSIPPVDIPSPTGPTMAPIPTTGPSSGPTLTPIGTTTTDPGNSGSSGGILGPGNPGVGPIGTMPGGGAGGGSAGGGGSTPGITYFFSKRVIQMTMPKQSGELRCVPAILSYLHNQKCNGTTTEDDYANKYESQFPGASSDEGATSTNLLPFINNNFSVSSIGRDVNSTIGALDAGYPILTQIRVYDSDNHPVNHEVLIIGYSSPINDDSGTQLLYFMDPGTGTIGHETYYDYIHFPPTPPVSVSGCK